MQAEIISIGDELTSGERLDTNSQWLSQRLGELGVTVVAHVTVADQLAMNVDVFRQAAERADIVIATGGLGPTADDLTREALAQATGRSLVLYPEALEHIQSLFARRKRPMPERNIVQAMFPDGSRVIPNPEGTAPGIALELPRSDGGVCHVFALPGVPAEMKQMWSIWLCDSLRQLGAGEQIIHHYRIKCFGAGESALEQMLPDLIRRGREPSVGITVHEATITLRITAAAASVEAARAAMQPTIDTIHQCLGELVFGVEDDELEHAVVRLLRERGQTLATVESDTAGLMTRWLSAAGDEQGPLRGGWIEPRAARTDPRASAEAWARAVRDHYGADYGLAVGPFPTDQELGGELPHALACQQGTIVVSAPFGAHSAIRHPLAAKQALNLLRLHLLKHD